MKYIFNILFIAILTSQSVVCAQGNIKTSTKIVQDIDGNNYFLHTVSKGDNLYALAKAYNVDVTEIIKNNTGVENGLKPGQQIKIPVITTANYETKETIPIVENDTKKTKKDKKQKKPQIEERQAPSGFVYKQILKGETLYSIARDYNTSVDVIKKNNPELAKNIKEGYWILLPVKQGNTPSVSDKPVNTVPKNDYSTEVYKVKKGDTFYSIQKRFKVSKEELESLNPILKTKGLQNDMEIKIPKQNLPETTSFERAPDKIGEISCNPIKNNTEEYKIGFLIPLFANLNNEIVISDVKKNETYKSFRFIEFYQGAILALDSLEKLGLHAKVYVWDTQADEKKTDSIINLPEFKSLNLLIGPFYSKNTNKVAAAAAENNTKFVDIFGKATNLYTTNNQAFIINPTDQSDYNALARYISDSIPNYKISIIHQGQPDELTSYNFLEKSLKSKYLKIDTNKIFVYNYNSGGLNKLLASLSPTQTNIIFNLVDDEAKISSFIRQLDLQKKKFPIMIMAQDKNWKKYNTLEPNYLSDLKYTFATDNYIDYSDSSNVIPFENKFYTNYGKIPGNLAYLGYDISWYFANELLLYGNNFLECISELPANNKKAIYSFEKKDNVFQNTSSVVVQCKDYKMYVKNR